MITGSQILAYLALKNDGDWAKIYNAIASKQTICTTVKIISIYVTPKFKNSCTCAFLVDSDEPCGFLHDKDP